VDPVWTVPGKAPKVGFQLSGQWAEEARKKAVALGAAVNVSFKQPDEVCTAYVALWLRGGVKYGTGFWEDPARFELIKEYEGTGKRYYPKKKLEDKAKALFEMEKGGTSAMRKQTDANWCRYIESGRKEEKGKILAYQGMSETNALDRGLLRVGEGATRFDRSLGRRPTSRGRFRLLGWCDDLLFRSAAW